MSAFDVGILRDTGVIEGLKDMARKKKARKPTARRKKATRKKAGRKTKRRSKKSTTRKAATRLPGVKVSVTKQGAIPNRKGVSLWTVKVSGQRGSMAFPNIEAKTKGDAARIGRRLLRQSL